MLGILLCGCDSDEVKQKINETTGQDVDAIVDDVSDKADKLEDKINETTGIDTEYIKSDISERIDVARDSLDEELGKTNTGITSHNFTKRIPELLKNSTKEILTGKLKLNVDDIPSEFYSDLKDIKDIDGDWKNKTIVMKTNSGNKYKFRFELDGETLKSIEYVKDYK